MLFRQLKSLLSKMGRRSPTDLSHALGPDIGGGESVGIARAVLGRKSPKTGLSVWSRPRMFIFDGDPRTPSIGGPASSFA